MNFEIGLSGLRSSQFAMSTSSHNIANASTEGYHRQRVLFSARRPQPFGRQFLGAGVEISSVDRYRNQLLESSFTNAVSDLEEIEQQLTLERRIESIFLPGDGSLQESLTNMFNELSALSANPGEIVQRNSVIQTASTLTEKFRSAAGELSEIGSAVRTQAELEVNELNREIRELVSLQNEINVASVHTVPNDLLDRRDQLVNSIAEKIDIQRNEFARDGFGLSIAGHAMGIDLSPIQFETFGETEGELRYRIAGTEGEVNFQSGRLTALQYAHNEALPKYVDQINELAGSIIRNFNQLHAQGVGASGPYTTLTSLQSAKHTNIPLDQAGLDFPVAAGELFISVTDANGDKRTESIAFDPSVDSLEDISQRLNDLDGVRSRVNQRGQLTVSGEPGYRFDFTGNQETTPDLASFSGTSRPTLSGRYTGEVNQDIRVEIVGSGTIGVTDGLVANVYDENGELVNSLDIGNGYEAGSSIELYSGVSISFPAGDVVDTESFETTVVAAPDTGGLLGAMGLNGFFSGSDALEISVSEAIMDDQNLLAVSKSGDDGDTLNLMDLIDLRDTPVLNDNSSSFDDYLGDVVADIGLQVRGSRSVQASLDSLKAGYQNEINAHSGVDINEELLDLTKFQKAYEASVQVIRTMEAMLDELFQVIR